MSPAGWLVVHLVAVAVLAGIGWVVQLVVYPGFALVGRAGWAAYHARHVRAITRVVLVPWAAQGVSTVALLFAPPAGHAVAALGLGVLAFATVLLTAWAAVPAHRGVGGSDWGTADWAGSLTRLLRVNLARALAWTASTGTAAALVAVG